MTPRHSTQFTEEARKTLSKLADEIRDQEKQLLDDADGVEAVHLARVAVNKLRVALNLFPVLIPKKLNRQLQDDLRWLKDALASVRDGDVIQELVRALGEPQYENDRPGLQAILNALREERAQHLKTLQALLAQLRFAQLQENLDALKQKTRKGRRKTSEDAQDSRLLEQDLSRLIHPLHAKFEKRRQALSDSFDSASMHALRISAKKFRYALDFFRDLKPELYPPLSQTLHDLHDCTGNLHDIDVLWPKLEQLSAHWQMTLSSEETSRLETGVEWVLYRLYAKRRELMREFYGLWATIGSDDFQSRARTAAGLAENKRVEM